MKRNKMWLSLSLLSALVMLTLGGSVAGAAPLKGGSLSGAGPDNVVAPDVRVRVMGHVASVNERGFVLTTQRGDIRVAVGDSTRIIVPDGNGGCVQGTLDDIQVGGLTEVVGLLSREHHAILAHGVRQCRAAPSE